MAMMTIHDGVRRLPSTRVTYAVWGLVAAIWFLLDQVTKALVVWKIEGQTIDLGIFDLRVIRNPGAAFGIPGLFPGLFVIVTVVVIVTVLRTLPRTDRLSLVVAYGLVTGGAVGNVADRIFRDPGFPSGRVVDFVDLRWWPVFNVADSGIVIGALLIVLLLTKIEREEQAASKGGKPPLLIDADP